MSITVVQLLFTTFTGLFHKKCNRLKARVVIYAYNHHVRLLSPEPMVVKQPQFTRVEEPTLLCNHVDYFRVRRASLLYSASVPPLAFCATSSGSSDRDAKSDPFHR